MEVDRDVIHKLSHSPGPGGRPPCSSSSYIDICLYLGHYHSHWANLRDFLSLMLEDVATSSSR